MSGTTLVFGADLTNAVPLVLDDRAAEPEAEVLAKKWPLEESMYVKVFKDAVATILKHEIYLLSESEIMYLKQLENFPAEALYILIRLALRKEGWHRKSDYQRYEAAMDSESKLEEAIRTLCESQIASPINENSKPVEGDYNAPIDLTCDSDDEENPPAPPVNVIMEDSFGTGTQQEVMQLSYHAMTHDEATPEELLGMLSLEELTKMARDYGVKTTGKKRKEVAEAILRNANSQSTLSFFKCSEPLEQSNGNLLSKSKSKTGGRLNELCLKALGNCIKLNPHVLLLIRRINLLFFRTTTYEAQLFVPAILVACKKRTYTPYTATRTTRVFESRDALLEYERALDLEVSAESILEKMHACGAAKKLQGTKAWDELEKKLLDVYNVVVQEYNAYLSEKRSDQRHGLERFEAGYVYTRTLYHIAFPIGKLNGLDVELQILENLLEQGRWLLSQRGGCYDRMACIYMKDMKNRVNVKKAHGVVVRALLDKHTHFRYRPKLTRRLTRIENALDIPDADRSTSQGRILKCEDIYILGERLGAVSQDEPLATQPKMKDGFILASSPIKKETKDPPKLTKRNTGKTYWESENGEPIGVEEFALEHYARHGFKGYVRIFLQALGENLDPSSSSTLIYSKHCEGRITRFIFALLFHDILFHPSVPGAFETAYQTAPLDLVHDTFYSARKDIIEERLKELLLPGRALEIVDLRDEELRNSNVFFVGGKWDAFKREEIMEIVEYMPEQVIHDICLVQAHDFEATGGGVPDLILWSTERNEVKFVEVKSPSDRLSETQMVWIHHLLSAGAAVEICHVETEAELEKREEKKERNRERAKRRSRSKSIASNAARRRRKSVADEEEEMDNEETDVDAATSDRGGLDVAKVEEEGDVKPLIKNRGRKRGTTGSGEEDLEEIRLIGTRSKRVKTEQVDD